MNRILGVDKAAQSISDSLPESARVIADKLPLAAQKLTENAPEALSAAAKSLTANLPEALSAAAKSLGESIDLKGIIEIPAPQQTRSDIISSVALTMAGAGILIAGLAYAYDVYKRNQRPSNE